MRGCKLIVRDHHGRWKSRSAYYGELLIKVYEEFANPPPTDSAVLDGVVAKRRFYTAVFPLPSKSYPLLEQWVLLSRNPQLHCFSMGCTQKPLQVRADAKRGELLSVRRSLLPASPLASAVLRVA